MQCIFLVSTGTGWGEWGPNPALTRGKLGSDEHYFTD
jgi:hypothetical protein